MMYTIQFLSLRICEVLNDVLFSFETLFHWQKEYRMWYNVSINYDLLLYAPFSDAYGTSLKFSNAH